jgi:hypothetical protein
VNTHIYIEHRDLESLVQPHDQWAPGAVSPVVKRQECEAGHSAPPSYDIKNGWSYTSTPWQNSSTWGRNID